LAAVRSACADADAEIGNTATSLLCDWPDPEALPDVIRLTETANDTRTKILALRGCCRLIPLQRAPVEQKVAWLKAALTTAERDEEKKLALAALATMPTPDALLVATPLLGDPGLREEAALAAVAVGEAIVQSHPSDVTRAMGRVLEATTNDNTVKRAKALLR